MDGWVRHYPPDVFPTLWIKLDEVINAGEIVATEEVYVELTKKSDELHAWIKDRKHVLVPLSEDIQELATNVLAEYPRLVDTLRNRSMADPFVIATAMELDAIVVTGEILTGKMDKPRIPDVCEAKGIRWMNFLQMIRELRLTF